MNHYDSFSNQQQQQYSGAQTPTIKNPQTGQLPKVKGPEINDRDRVNDMLLTEKYLTDGFNVFVREASHQSLYNDVLHILNQSHQAARDLFNLMFEKGWYTMHPEQPNQIAQQQQKFSGYQSQFANTNTNSNNPSSYQNQYGNSHNPF